MRPELFSGYVNPLEIVYLSLNLPSAKNGSLHQGKVVNYRINLTDDGSHSLIREDTGEGYHSRNGAVTESLHVFIGAGFDAVKDRDQIHILEVGFGTGLNAFLTIVRTFSLTKEIHYDAIEPFPLEEEIYKQLNYPHFAGNLVPKGLFIWLHESEWEKPVRISRYFRLRKFKCRFDDFNPEGEKYDLIYFDAFSPEIQPELWTPAVFSRIFAVMKPGGILVTYCAKGYVRRSLISLGFLVERLQGPKGKREMLRAAKPLQGHWNLSLESKNQSGG